MQKNKKAQEWMTESRISREIYNKTGGTCLDGNILSSPIPIHLAKKFFLFYKENMISRMVAARLNRERGNIAKTIKYILTLPKNHKHRKYFEKHLNWIIKNGNKAEKDLRDAWDKNDSSPFRTLRFSSPAPSRKKGTPP